MTTTYTFDENTVSDLHKDARGWRPREYFWNEWNAASDAEKQVIWDGLCKELDWEMEREAQAQARAIEEFEATILANISLGARDRESAIRWIIEANDPSEFDLQYGGGWACWSLGLPYHGYEKELDGICKAMLESIEKSEE